MSHTITVNPRVLAMEYAVRGPIPQRAAQMAKDGRTTIPCNIGNPQALGQKPITFYRQALSLLEDPSSIERARVGGGSSHYPEDVVETASRIIEASRTGSGAYTESAGFVFVREAVSRFIDQRDEVAAVGGLPSDPESVLLTDGASGGAAIVLEALISDESDGILVPIPQYPLYSATIARCGGVLVGYHPDEESGWTLNRDILESALVRARAEGTRVKAIVVINPGNPTGALLDGDSVKEVVQFAEDEGLAIIADEVYQENTYGRPWTSFARVVGRRKVPLFSLHSVSKGFYGECGHRGGYLEVRHAPMVEGTQMSLTDVFLKQASVNLCPNTMGQFLVHLMATGPLPGGPSEQLFLREREAVLHDLQAKAAMIKDSFAKMDGMECFGETGAMYLFPRIAGLPSGKSDFDYCMALLEETGMVTVNGAGFGQREGTHHLRVAFLPPFDLIEQVMPQWVDFHNRFVG